MKPKKNFTIIIAVIFIAVIYFYHDTMSFLEIVGAFVANSLLITTVWQWFRAEEKETRAKYLETENQKGKTRIKNLQDQNDALFEKAYGGEKPKASDEEL